MLNVKFVCDGFNGKYRRREKRKALKALKAVIEAFDMDYNVEEDIDFFIGVEQKKEILRREVEYRSGRMKLYSIDEAKSLLNFKE